MNDIDYWKDLFLTPLADLSSTVMMFLPQLIGALVVLIVGMLVVGVLMKILKKLLSRLPLDSVMEKTGVSGELEKVGIKVPLSAILTGVISLFLKLIVWMAAIDVLNITQLSTFLDQILNYIPNVFVAVILLAVGITLGKVVEGLVEKSLGSINAAKHSAEVGGKIAKVSILVLTVFATLSQLGIAEELVETLLMGIIGALTIATGIAFGLGGKEKATAVLDKIGK